VRLSQHFPPTLRETPASAPSEGVGWLVRAGALRLLEDGLAYLPLGWRALQALQALVREELAALSAQEWLPPIGFGEDEQPLAWDYLAYPPNPGGGLLSSHLTAMLNLARREIQTYRQLPLYLYTMAPLAAAPWERLAPYRLRQSLTAEGFALVSADFGLEQARRHLAQALHNLLRRCGLPFRPLDMGDALAWFYLHPQGEETSLICPACGYAALQRTASLGKPQSPAEPPLPLEPVHTPGVQTIRDLAAFLGLPESRLAKAVFYLAKGIPGRDGAHLVLAVVRGERTLSEAKLARAVRARFLRPADESAILAAGAVPGYASPIGLRGGLVVVDDLITTSPNLVAGANRPDYHLRNVNYGRDFHADLVTDLTLAEPGDPCPHCAAPLKAERGTLLAWVGEAEMPSDTPLTCLDERGEARPLRLVHARLGLDALLLSIGETHHDAHGLRWPPEMAPFDVHLVALAGAKAPQVSDEAERLYGLLQAAGVRVLYDDREVSPGVKFNDADLMGLPLRLTLSARTLESAAVEVKWRDEEERHMLPLAEALGWVAHNLRERRTAWRHRRGESLF